MYKEYVLESELGNLIGGNNQEHWSRLWAQKNFSNSRQVKTLERTPQWRAIEKLTKPGERILEAGCGLGTWVRFFASQRLLPVGLDYSEQTIDNLNNRFPDYTWVKGDIRNIPLPDDQFDALVSWGVIEHLEEGPQRALKEFVRVLRPGGYVFVSVPWLSPYRIRSGFQSGGDNSALFNGRDNAEFYQYYITEKELSDYCSQAGFKVVKVVPSSIHAKTLLPMTFRKNNPFLTKIYNRIFSKLLPAKLIASMILLVGQKPL